MKTVAAGGQRKLFGRDVDFGFVGKATRAHTGYRRGIVCVVSVGTGNSKVIHGDQVPGGDDAAFRCPHPDGIVGFALGVVQLECLGTSTRRAFYPVWSKAHERRCETACPRL